MCFCEVPLGNAPIEADVVENRLNQEVAAYFKWVSGGAANRMVELARLKALPLVSFRILVIATIFFFLDQPALASDQHEWDLLELTTGPSG